MSACLKMAWCLAILLNVITLTISMPYEIVYTGDGCDCPKSLGYKVNVPRLPKPKELVLNEYGYKVEVPVQSKAKVTYSFDFTVEEPRIPKPPKPTKLNLFAKIDRITMNRGDCLEGISKSLPPSLSDAVPAATYPCSCSKCGISKPTYRYVYQKTQPCKCQRPRCNCNSENNLMANTIPIDEPMESMSSEANRNSYNNIRQKRDVSADINREKRDIQRLFFRNRNQRPPVEERPNRFVKLYHKKLSDQQRQDAQFDNDDDFDDTKATTRRGGPFNFLQRLRPRLVKRDIKGEYDLIQKDHEDTDLTLPEVIQYMPETLQPNFKRGQCRFGCACDKMHNTPTDDAETTTTEQTDVNLETTERLNNDEATVTEETIEYQKDTPSLNTIDSSNHAKRNAASYNQDFPLDKSASAISSQVPQFVEQFTDRAKQQSAMQGKSSNPNFYSAQSGQNTNPAPSLQSQKSSQYFNDRIGQKYMEKDGRLRFSVSDPTGSDGTPLQYAGDLEIPPKGPPPTTTVVDGAPQVSLPPPQSRYPVRTISSAALDKVITDIVYRHPDFIDASSHYGGALVDPEPYQEEQTKDFLKKLIDRRLQLWFGDEEDRRAYQATYFTNPSQFGYPKSDTRR